MWVIGAFKDRARGRARRPAQRVRVPARRPLRRALGDPLEPERAALVQLRRRPAAALRDARRARPDRSASVPGAALYAETVCATVPQLRRRADRSPGSATRAACSPRAAPSSRAPITAARPAAGRPAPRLAPAARSRPRPAGRSADARLAGRGCRRRPTTSRRVLLTDAGERDAGGDRLPLAELARHAARAAASPACT